MGIVEPVWSEDWDSKGRQVFDAPLVIQPSLLGGLQANKRLYVKKQGGQPLRNGRQTCPMPTACTLTEVHVCVLAATHSNSEIKILLDGPLYFNYPAHSEGGLCSIV